MVTCDKCKRDILSDRVFAVTVTSQYSGGDYMETLQLQLCNDCHSQVFKMVKIPDRKQEQERHELVIKKFGKTKRGIMSKAA